MIPPRKWVHTKKLRLVKVFLWRQWYGNVWEISHVQENARLVASGCQCHSKTIYIKDDASVFSFLETFAKIASWLCRSLDWLYCQWYLKTSWYIARYACNERDTVLGEKNGLLKNPYHYITYNFVFQVSEKEKQKDGHF